MEYEIKVKLRSNNNSLDCTYNWMIKHGIWNKSEITNNNLDCTYNWMIKHGIWNKSEITFKQQFIGLHI